MRRVLLMLGAATLALSACQAAPTPAGNDGAPAPAAATGAAAAPGVTSDFTTAKPPSPTASAPAATNAAAPVVAQPPPNPAATPLLAYSYDYGISAPPANIRVLVQKEEQDCTAAGVAACEITGVNVSQTAPDQVTGQLTLKATPAWLKGYEGRLSADAQGAGGQLTKTQVTTEDLSRQIVDTQAAVAAKTALRDRLQQMLQTRQADLSDLLAVEDKLADVQGDLDATNSELAAMRERVATSDVTIDYASAGLLAPQGAWAPLGGAVSGATGVLATSVAVLIYLVAFVAPWALIIGGALWVFRKRIFRTRPRAAASGAGNSSPPPQPPSSPGVNPGDP